EEAHLRLSPNVVGGLGLLTGTYIGARGIGGAVLDKLRDRREAAALAAAGLDTTVVLPGDVPEPVVIDTVPSPRSRARAGAGRSGGNGRGDALVGASAGGLGSALRGGGGLVLPPRPGSRSDGGR
ncbi:MAG: hypothetical protein QOJ19_24, partial [Acidimicrobiia bacterium]|nr:hypothetical protein [Acidimicrobiia bacterium]